jgi:hypothetical protein
MQKIYLLLPLLIAAIFAEAQRNEFGFGYQLSKPQGNMKNGWDAGHGIQMQYHRYLRDVKGLGFGVNFGYGNYAWERNPQQYRFPNGSVTNTTAVLSSSLVSAGASVKIVPFVNKRFSPFAEIQAGIFGMVSSIYIEDPADPLGCRALENRNLVSSSTFYQAAGIGVQWQPGKSSSGSRHLIELSIKGVRGGDMEYANMKHVYDQHSQTSVQNPRQGSGERPLVVRFVNVQTNEQHDHSVAEIYNHPLRMVQLNLQYSFRFSKIFNE